MSISLDDFEKLWAKKLKAMGGKATPKRKLLAKTHTQKGKVWTPKKKKSK